MQQAFIATSNLCNDFLLKLPVSQMWWLTLLIPDFCFADRVFALKMVFYGSLHFLKMKSDFSLFTSQLFAGGQALGLSDIIINILKLLLCFSKYSLIFKTTLPAEPSSFF